MSANCVYTVRDVATLLKVSTKTVYGLIHDGELRCIWVRGQIRISSQQLENYIKGGDSHDEESSRNTL